MNLFNYIMIILSAFVLLIGILALINPNWSRLINFPGGPRFKAIAATIAGIILLIVGLIVEVPME